MDGGLSSKHLQGNNNASNHKHEAFTKLTSFVNSPRGSGCKTDSETNLDRTRHGSARILDSTDIVSVSSSISSSDDLFQVNPGIILKSNEPNNIPKPHRGTKPLSEDDKVDVSSEALYGLEESVNESSESTSQFSDITHESILPNMSPTQYPRIQVMERVAGFDPNRIPASVFNRSPGPMDWSAASNESLFSIHIENNSLSRDRASTVGVDLQRSQELLWSGELYQSGEPCKSGKLYQPREFCNSRELPQSADFYKPSGPAKKVEFLRSKEASPVAKGEPSHYIELESSMCKELNQRTTETVDVSGNNFPQAHTDAQVGKKLGESRDSSLGKHQSDGSKPAIQSFAIPKKKKSSCPLCHCSRCYHAFCCCKWSSWCCFKSCSCKCLRCSGCSCKWFSCRGWCCKWPSCKCHCPKCTWACCCCWKKSKSKDPAMTRLTI